MILFFIFAVQQGSTNLYVSINDFPIFFPFPENSEAHIQKLQFLSTQKNS